MLYEDVKMGQVILIRKGTKIRTMGPIRHTVAGKDYKVQVHHKLSGRRITANTLLNDKDYYHYMEILGIKESDLRALRDSDNRAFHCDCDIEIIPPSVVWSGRNGWSEAACADVELVIA